MDLRTTGSKDDTNYRRYDVFVSFKGETRNTFMDHLFIAFDSAGISVFRDDLQLPRGTQIAPALVEAIEGSITFVIVFSKNYATSTWCLDELAKIIECMNAKGQLVLPVFYDVDPSDLRKEGGTFAEAFDCLEKRLDANMEKVRHWQAQLRDAAALSGFHLKDRLETEVIRGIVEEVRANLKRKPLFVAKYPVGVDSRVKEVCKSLLNVNQTDVHMIGIYGMKGVGKTVLAKAVYNFLIKDFKYFCFLEDVRNQLERNDLINLQEKLLLELLPKRDIKVKLIQEGQRLIIEACLSKKVLIVIDGVDKVHQVRALVEHPHLCGKGSVIIVTTRNESLLTELNVDGEYHAKELDLVESAQLFNCHAYRQLPDQKQFQDVQELVSFARQIPAALAGLGSYLYGRRFGEWRSVLEELRKIPSDKILEELSKMAVDHDYVPWANKQINSPGFGYSDIFPRESMRFDAKDSFEPFPKLFEQENLKDNRRSKARKDRCFKCTCSFSFCVNF